MRSISGARPSSIGCGSWARLASTAGAHSQYGISEMHSARRRAPSIDLTAEPFTASAGRSIVIQNAGLVRRSLACLIIDVAIAGHLLCFVSLARNW